MVVEIKTVEEFKNIHKQNPNTLIIIDYYAIWCGPCMRFNPTLEMLAQKYDNVRFYKINSDTEETKEICKACDVTQLPTFCFFKNGEYIKKLIGADQVKIEELIKKLA